MSKGSTVREKKVLHDVLESLSGLDNVAQNRIIRTVATFLELENKIPEKRSSGSAVSMTLADKSLRAPKFSDHKELSPKDFMLDKSPNTDVEKAICFAYYLLHYRDIQHFKTADISKLNTEAAQRKFANAAYAVNNAMQSGYIVPAPKNHKQLSSIGERYIEALPDRAAAKSIVAKMRPRKRKTTKSNKKQR